MLEGLAAWVLNNYIGEYVENLNTHQLSIGVFQGQIELENLPLKKDALKKLDLPLEVKSGFIGRIHLSIPVKRLKSEPWVITLERLYLIAGPIQNEPYNEKEEKQKEYAAKELQLKALEEKWKQEDGVSTGSSVWSVTPMFANILENIQLKVKDVHIRYEDDITIPGSSFACGITIKSLSAQSTDASWLPKFVSKYDTDMMRKLVDLQEFSAYWDTNCEMVGNLNRSELEDVLQRPMFKCMKTGQFKDHEFLLEPVSAQAKMKRNTSALPLRSANSPRITLDIQLEKIPLALSEKQYRGMVAWMKEFTRYARRRKYRRWRPACSVKESPRLWWKFAIDANLHAVQERNRRATVEFMTKRCRDNCLYVDAYIDYVAIGTMYMEERLKEHMEEMERELTFEEIKLLREVARAKMKNSLNPKNDASLNDSSESSPLADSQVSADPEQTVDGQSTETQDDSSSGAQSQGLFQRWFPGWAGWYGSSYATSEPQKAEDLDLAAADASNMEDQNFEQEVMDILNDTEDNNTLLRRDTVFAQLNFQLQTGVFRLLHDSDLGLGQSSVVMLELECSEVSMELVSRPRTNGMRFGISVGGLYLRDKMTANSIMPVLIAPQHRERSNAQNRQMFTGVLGAGLGRVSTPLPTTFLGTTAALSAPVNHTLFELIYEKKPPHCKADYRLDIKTKPLDILYNPTAIKRVKDFFTVKTGLTSVQSDIELAAAAKSRYEAIKRQTEEELKHTIDELLEQDDTIKAKRWSFNLDIAAPQIIIPLNFTEMNTTLVVFDLGRLQFQNVTAGIKDDLVKTDDDEEEAFVTPSSTPPQEPEEPKLKTSKDTTAMLSDIFSENLSEAAIRDKIYDKYKLSLSDLQVMVGRSKDNWRFAHMKGTSHLHIVDKFSISLQLDRRLLYTSDPQWPKATMAGTLPSLTLHVNETKIQALKNCVKLLTESNMPSPVTENKPLAESLQTPKETEPTDKSMYYSMYQAYSKSFKTCTDRDEEDKATDAKQILADSVLCLMQFTISKVSLEVQSRGHSIAELQVEGVNANFTMRPFDTSVSFSLHSLLIVDALQTFGPDFELLVASHRNLCLDSQSGSIRDSEPNSPLSPQSPGSPSSPAEPDKPTTAGSKSSISVVHAASSALQGLTTSGLSLSPDDESPVLSPGSVPEDAKPSLTREAQVFQTTENGDALIKVELDLISPNCPTNTSTDETLHIANVQFNNLDFIANQQTLIELIGFFHRVMPSQRRKVRSSESLHKDEQGKHSTMSRWEFSAEFHRLNILLMRVEEKEVAHKVATATMSGARVSVTLASQGMTVKGSLGGVQVQNLTSDVIMSKRHQKVFSVGCDPHNPSASPLASQYDFKAFTDVYQTATSTSMFLEGSTERAFTFSLFKRNDCMDGVTEDLSIEQGFRTSEVIVTLKLASVCYTHSPDFLRQLSMCVTEFRGYMVTVGSSLKVAAREMAIGLVNQRSDAYAVDGGTSRTRHAPSIGDLNLDPSFDSFSQSMEDLLVPDDVSRTVIKLDINLETPVVLLPRRPDSPEVLVVHLGRISLRNFDHPVASTFADAAQFCQTVDDERIYVEVRDMSMYSVNLDRQRMLEQVITTTNATSAGGGLALNTSAFRTPQPGGFTRTNYGIPILHDTILELTIEKREPLSHQSNRSIDLTLGDTPFVPFPQKSDSTEPRSSVLQVNGKLISPLKLALSKDVYEQILQTLDNLVPSEDETKETVAGDFSPLSSTMNLDDVAVSDDRQKDDPSSTASATVSDENSSSSSARLLAAPLRETSTSSGENMMFKAYFEMPVFSVELTGDLGEGEQGLVELKLEDFEVNFEKSDPWTKSVEISLQSLIMEDLLQDRSSKHRYLMVSTRKPQSPDIDDFHLPLSQSCPTAMIDIPPASLPRSLPSSFHEESVFVDSKPRTRMKMAKANVCSSTRTKSLSGCPCTPPPSLQMSRRQSQSSDSRLVHVKMLLIERRCPEFKSKYNSTNRFIDVDFNGLDTTINLQTWVVLLDFLGMGAKVHNTDKYEPASPTSKMAPKLLNRVNSKRDEQEEATNLEIDLKVQSLSLILNKPEYELAKANISRFNSHITLRDGTFAIKGQLGSMSVRDESPHGSMYREKFTTTGNQALDFHIFNYGKPDPMLTREHDIAINLRMNSVWYVHTQRFLMETLAFAQNFNQLQDVLGRMRAASAGQKISEKAFRGSRIKIDIEAGAPIIFIPHSSKSTDILVIDLGAISVHNTFMKAGSEGTISFHRSKLQKEQATDGEDERVDNDSGKMAFSNVSCSNGSAYVTCRSGLPGERMSSGGVGGDLMSQSTYGSLEQDSRSALFESWRSASEGGLTETASSPGASVDVGSFPSFCSSVGIAYSGSSAVSTAIGEWNRSTPNQGSSSEGHLSEAGGTSYVTACLLTENHECLLDVLSVELTEMDLFSAEWMDKDKYKECDNKDDLVFPSYIVKREPGKVLKEKGRLTLQVERNLEGDISHNVPDISVDGKLTSVHFQLNLKQYKMVRGFLAHNFGEELEPFQTPMMSQLQDPQIHTVLSGRVWKAMSINLDLDGVTTELLISHSDGTPASTEVSLAKFEFITSRLSYDSFSDGSKDIDLISHEIRVLDTRYRDSPVNVRPNVFPEILKPSIGRTHPKALQMELHYRSTKQFTRFTILLNNMRVMGIFDWLLVCKDFLLTTPDNPYEDRDSHSKQSKSVEKPQRQDSSPATVSTGVLTKRASSVTEKKDTSFELRLNITDTELVVVEDTTGRDTNAVILKSTAVFSYKPDFSERPVSCSLQSLEVFSCSLAAEDETALSIIDPMSITIELNGSPSKKVETLGPTGLTDATNDSDNDPPILEISFTTLNIRLSYNDMMLFLAIMKTVPDQLIQAKHQGQPPKNAAQCQYPAEQIQKLENLGFSRADCETALSACEGQLDEAVMWLTQNAVPVSSMSVDQRKDGFSLSGFEVKASAICVCFIDDCLDADVPLAELTFSGLTFLHRFFASGKGKSSFKLTGDYYNRSLSGWEPFIESWGCIVTWNQLTSDENRVQVNIHAGQVLNFNFTSSLLEQYRKTKQKWTRDYYKEDTQTLEEGSYNSRKRIPFIPYAIRNQTGCKLWFATMTTKPTRIGTITSPGCSKDSSQRTISEWRMVASGDELPFLFEEREKIRHKHTHELKVHQVIVQVEGWREVSAVSVDKVGTYFRTARPEVNPSSMYSKPPARIVFDVTLEGSAHKVITVRSGLMVHNRLDDDIEIRLQNTLAIDLPSPISPDSGNEKTFVVKQGAKQAIPIHLVHSRMWIRPQGWSLDWCKQPILWQHVTTSGEPSNSMKSCTTIFSEKASYRFCISIYRQHFPPGTFTLGPSPAGSPVTPTERVVYSHPGHIITLMPPVMLENLLPIDICYSLKSGNQQNIRGSIKPGKVASLFAADLSQNLELGISFDNMTTSKNLVIPPGTLDYKVKLVLFDSLDRPLELIIRIKAGIGGSLKLSVSAPYWLVNKTGLPLIFKQDGAKTAAGQFEEHELARSVVPLLFSYTEKDRTTMCTVRLGKYIHGVNSKALWTNRFSLESGSGVRELHVSPNDNRPDWVYMIGIEVRQGKGRYCDTNIVTFSPRYQLDNHSSHKLAFAQKYAVVDWSPSSVDYFSALPNCTLSFHWPRVDKDNLLCVQLMNDPDSQWSGGFLINKVDSFHINIRSKDNRYVFLRVDVVLHGATYYVVLSDADHMPPPYRIENYSEVPVVFYQTNTRHDLRSIVRPHSQVPYALDEPVLPPHITLKVIGGSSATYNLHNVKDGDQLYYENHIYLAFTGTFKNSGHFSPRTSNWISHMEQHQLVLDVLPNNRVILKKMEAGKRSQLWRMTSRGMLQHEGSAAPRDPGKMSAMTSSASSVFYVLDIADYQLRPDAEMGLAIRKSDDKRKATQHWMFTKDGRLVCSSRPNLCVQAKGGIFGLRDGEDAVLGPSPPKIADRRDVPIEMAVHNEKSRPGSGQLFVKVLVDGPTRVLRITDVTQQKLYFEQADDWILVDGGSTKLPSLTNSSKPESGRFGMYEVTVVLPEGIGLSLVNAVPEELLYISLRDIHINYLSTDVGQRLEMTVSKFQIDNQLFGQYRPVLLFVTQYNSHHDDEEDKGAALQISVHKVPNKQWNADIYKHFIITMKRLTVQIEETLLWKFLQFFDIQQNETDIESISEMGVDSNRDITAVTSVHLKRYYFGTLKIDIHRLMLSMLTASELSPDLKVLKKSLGIPLVRFADAQVDLEPFVRHHPFETSAFLIESIQHHFTEELKSQAASILGSVDFLGNPLGFFNDVAEGVSGLLEGNVGGLLKNVTHGVSNSAAKVTGSLSDGVGVATLDNQHQKIRQQIRYASEASGGSGHLKAGLKALGHGLFGGLTSIVSQTYTGMAEDGFEGFFTGLGKGVVGTVTKPVAGVLDFAAGAASAVRDTSRCSSKVQPSRVRKPRVCQGPGGLLPAYSEEIAAGQEYLHKINDNNYSEICIAVEVLRGGRDDTLRALISSEHVYLLAKNPRDKEYVILDPSYEELINSRPVIQEDKPYLMLTMKADTDVSYGETGHSKSPLVRCDTERIAQKVSQQINYAKVLYDEVKHTLPVDADRQDSLR